jgi:hypothetical protein
MFRVVCIEYSCILCDKLSSRKIANENTYQVEIELAQATSMTKRRCSWKVHSQVSSQNVDSLRRLSNVSSRLSEEIVEHGAHTHQACWLLINGQRCVATIHERRTDVCRPVYSYLYRYEDVHCPVSVPRMVSGIYHPDTYIWNMWRRNRR